MNIKDILGGAGGVNIQNVNVFVMPNGDSKPEVINPGVEYGTDGKAKWSPPLQQQLDTMKDAVGPTTDSVIEEPSEEEVAELTQDTQDPNIERIKKLAAIFTPNSMPSG